MKNRKLLALLLVFTMLFGCMLLPVAADGDTSAAWDGTASAAPSGAGTESDPYQISNGAELKWLSALPLESAENVQGTKGTFSVLTADIDLGGKEWTPGVFGGTFDGKNHTVSNFTVKESVRGGLFATLNGAMVKDLRIDQVEIALADSDSAFGGALAGYVEKTTVYHVTVGEHVSVTGYNVGGLIGRSWNAGNTVSYCTNNATVTTNNARGGELAGGIVGLAAAVNISYCVNNGTITAGNNGEQIAGGIAADLAEVLLRH